MLNQEIIEQQLTLLATLRRTLAILLQQLASLGGITYGSPGLLNSIQEARSHINNIKLYLRERGVQVEDDLNDEPGKIASIQQFQENTAYSDVLFNDRVIKNRIMSDKRVVNTDKGDYAEGNIDKRQSVFLEGNVYGNVIGLQVVDQAALFSPSLYQLRAPVNNFVGREQEIEQLVQALSKTDGRMAAISSVRGMGGIGKTELAFMVANRLKDIFYDAQIFIELHGSKGNQTTADAALRHIIRSFSNKMPETDDIAQLQSNYRSLLSGKHVLIFADDANNAGQIYPLLPPSGCALLMTSRNRFNVPGMWTINLEILSSLESERLLLDICPRIGPHAVILAELCGYLPLALQVSASLLRENDSRDVGVYITQLRRERLKYLADPDNANDPQASVEASLRLSYDALDSVSQDVLCQMSVFPTSYTKEALEEIVVIDGDVVHIAELLQRRSLIVWDGLAKRHQLHDLVREFASVRQESVNEVNLRFAKYYIESLWRRVLPPRSIVHMGRSTLNLINAYKNLDDWMEIEKNNLNKAREIINIENNEELLQKYRESEIFIEMLISASHTGGTD